jgi:hypothetical protein
VLLAIEPAKQLRPVILDACRDNPFAKIMKRTVASRAIGQGLAKVEPASPNTLIAYAAKAGSTAADGRLRARRRPEEHQQPAGAVCLRFARRRRCAAGAGQGRSTRIERASRYTERLRIGAADRQQGGLECVLAQYPDGFYANLSKLQLAKIAAEKAQQAVQQQAAAAEQKRVAAESAAADKDAAEKIGKDDGVADHPPASKPIAGRSQDTKQDTKVAALPDPSAPAPPSPADLAKSVQTELRRVGCLAGSADGEWNRRRQRADLQLIRIARSAKAVALIPGHCERSEAIQRVLNEGWLLRRFAPRNDDRARRAATASRRASALITLLFVRRRVGASAAGVGLADGDHLNEYRRGECQSEREGNFANH